MPADAPDPAAPDAATVEGLLAFFRAAGALKDTARNSWTAEGRRESVAEHTFRVALMALALEDAFPGIDAGRVLRLALVHDLGEALGGDVPAPRQGSGDKTATERADLAVLLAPLPAPVAARIAALWEEQATAASLEARIVKGLDRIETVLQHVEGANPPGFDYRFNLDYGRRWTDADPRLAALRAPVDAETLRRAEAVDEPGVPPAPAPVTLAVAGAAARFPLGRIFCVGRNFEAHAAEMGTTVDREAPFYFTKSPAAAAPSGGTVPYPPGTKDCQHEIELAVAIGRGGAAIPVTEALAHVWGYGVALDMTRRDLQAAAKAVRRPWDLGKDFEASAIFAPLAPVARCGHPAGRIRLAVNGAARQDADLSEMVWSVAEIIAHLSGFYHLRPGDVILTGTPAGVGPVVPGDRLAGRIDGLPPLDVAIGPPA
jgi:fumarylpyruvate hydrolase